MKGFALERRPDEHDANDTRLVLRDLQDDKLSPLSVDFLAGATLHRLKHGLSKSQPLSKALGLKSLNPKTAPFVLDATAGLGTDSFFIAALGCRVRAIERNETVFALVEDGWRRFCSFASGDGSDDERIVGLASRLTLERGDAGEALRSLDETERPDVVYLDPMYPEPERLKTALPKKSMQMFRRLIGDDLDADGVLELALKQARDRVVVKRPLDAPVLGGRKPTHVFEGKTARYDMYLSTSAR